MGDIVQDGEVCELAGVEEAAWLRVIELGSLCCVPMAIKAAIELNVLNILAAHNTHMLSPAQIISHMPIISNNPNEAASSLDRILRLLACHGVLHVSTPDTSLPHWRAYGLNDVSKYLVHNDHRDSLAPIILLNQDKVYMDTWHYLADAVLDGGEPFTKAHGEDLFSYNQHDLRFNNLLNSTMANHTKLLIKSFLDTYSGFHDVATLVDVGGGFGSCLSMIISKHPHIKAINFDQPHVVAAAPTFPNIENVGGDMFVSILDADAIFMKWILHNWRDEHCVNILKNCYKALPKQGGKVILVDAILPTAMESGARSRVGYHLDILMLAYTQGGRERTHQELLTISKLAGFTRMQVVSNINECSVVELYKS